MFPCTIVGITVNVCMSSHTLLDIRINLGEVFVYVHVLILNTIVSLLLTTILHAWLRDE